METTKTANVRKIQKTEKDYEAYIQCFFRTDYSDEVGKRSKSISNRIYFSFKDFCKLVDGIKDRSCILVCENEYGQVVAAAHIKTYKQTLTIKGFMVDRNFQLCGYGKAFYEEIEKEAKKRRYKEIILNSFFDGAIIFWLKMGFTNAGIFIKRL